MLEGTISLQHLEDTTDVSYLVLETWPAELCLHLFSSAKLDPTTVPVTTWNGSTLGYAQWLASEPFPEVRHGECGDIGFLQRPAITTALLHCCRKWHEVGDLPRDQWGDRLAASQRRHRAALAVLQRLAEDSEHPQLDKRPVIRRPIQTDITVRQLMELHPDGLPMLSFEQAIARIDDTFCDRGAEIRFSDGYQWGLQGLLRVLCHNVRNRLVDDLKGDTRRYPWSVGTMHISENLSASTTLAFHHTQSAMRSRGRRAATTRLVWICATDTLLGAQTTGTHPFAMGMLRLATAVECGDKTVWRIEPGVHQQGGIHHRFEQTSGKISVVTVFMNEMGLDRCIFQVLRRVSPLIASSYIMCIRQCKNHPSPHPVPSNRTMSSYTPYTGSESRSSGRCSMTDRSATMRSHN